MFIDGELRHECRTEHRTLIKWLQAVETVHRLEILGDAFQHYYDGHRVEEGCQDMKPWSLILEQ